MHVVHSSRNRIPWIEVISRSGAHHVSEREVLSLRKRNPQRFLRVNGPDAASLVEIGHDPPITMNEISPDTVDENKVSGFRPPWNERDGATEGEIKVAA